MADATKQRDIRRPAADPLRDVAMQSEPERYIAATLAPRADQAGLIAVAAFAADISRIPALVSEPTLGQIRLQWWRDAIEGGLKGVWSGHPVADALIDALAGDRTATDWALEMIEAREFDLSGGVFSDDSALFAYLDKTDGHAFRLALARLGAQDFGVAGLAGRAFGLARALSRLAMLHHNGGLPLTADRLRRAGIEADALGSSPVTEATHRAVDLVVDELRGQVRTDLAAAREQFAELPRRQRAALLPLAMVEPYLRTQRQSRTLEHVGGPSPLTQVVRMGFAHFRGRV